MRKDQAEQVTPLLPFPACITSQDLTVSSPSGYNQYLSKEPCMGQNSSVVCRAHCPV